MENTLVFIHGLESTAQGTKGQFFRKFFPQMIIEDYTGNFATRMRKLDGLLSGKNDLILVGSSYGGLMATQYAIDNENKVEPLRQEPEASFQNATSRDWQKAFNPQRELGAFCSGVKKMILLAPALNLTEFKPPEHTKLHLPVIIYHGNNDDVVNPYIVKNIALKYFSNLEHHLVEDDHSLHKTFPALDWTNLLLTD